MLFALIIISALFVLAFLLLWTWMRFQRISRGKEIDNWVKKLWWGLLISSFVLFVIATIVFFFAK